MQAILRRIPSAEDIERNKAKIAGAVTGAFGTLAVMGLVHVSFTGVGLFEERPTQPPIYTDF